jgi:hypothetical protein
MSDEFKKFEDERAPELNSDLEAQLDEIGSDPAQVGTRSAGQAGSSQALSSQEDAGDESVEELADTDQAWEAASVEGLEDAADHPERPAHTHEEYGRPEDLPPPRRNSDAA